MKFEIRRDKFIITPETPQDIAFIEDTLDLRTHGAYIRLERQNAHGVSVMGYLRTVPPAPEELSAPPHPPPPSP